MSAFNKLSDWEKQLQPQRNHISRQNGDGVKLMVDTLEQMVEHDCTDLSDEELEARLQEALESGDLPVRHAMAVMELLNRSQEEGV